MTGAEATAAPALASIAPLLDPERGVLLGWDSPHSLVGPGSGRWPVVEGIPWLRVGRDRLRSATLDALDSGDARGALVGLLADQDDHARTPSPPDRSTLGRLIDSVDAGRASLRDAMAALGYGPVADYFAHRWSTPTYLSGLALLERHWLPGASVVEVACGIGAFLRDLSLRGVPALGMDVVFSKLWLARRYVVPPAVSLACADVSAGWPLGPPPSSTPILGLCHDAFYFLPDKARLVHNLRNLVGDTGRILIGHAHNSRFDHRGISGEPMTPEEYADLLPGARLFNDAELALEAWSDVPAVPRGLAELAGVEAVAIAWNAREDIAGLATPGPGLSRLRPGARLRPNPMLEDGPGGLRPCWPSPRFEAEYAAGSTYLVDESIPGVEPSADGEARVDRLVRRRVLLDLPERW